MSPSLSKAVSHIIAEASSTSLVDALMGGFSRLWWVAPVDLGILYPMFLFDGSTSTNLDIHHSFKKIWGLFLFIYLFLVGFAFFIYVCVWVCLESKIFHFNLLPFRVNFSVVKLGLILIWLSCLKIYAAKDHEAQSVHTPIFMKHLSLS